MTQKEVANSKPGRSWIDWVEPWYLAYALQGAVIAGLLPILLPLAVNQSGNAAHIGLVMAALNLGGLSAPLWGGLADKYRLHRWLLVIGLVIVFVSLLVFSISAQPAIWMILALLIGFGTAASATIANLFVVEAHPKPEWDERIGWLQTYYGVGQVIGLLLAGVLSQAGQHLGILVGAGLSGTAALIGFFTAKTPLKSLPEKPVLSSPVRHIESISISPQRLFHHLNFAAFKKIYPYLLSSYGLFLLAWIFAIGGSAAFFSQYPVLMQKVYGIPSHVSSIGYAVVAGLAMLLYSPAGKWSEKFGPLRTMQTSLGVRLLAYAVLFIIGFILVRLQAWFALPAFAFVVGAWSVISVSGTALAAQLSPVGEGEGLGLFNAVNALSNVLGAALGGIIAVSLGYRSITAMAVLGIAIGLFLTFLLRRKKGSSAP